MLTQEAKQEIIAKYAVHEGDTGSPEVQIAVLHLRKNAALDFGRRDAIHRNPETPRQIGI